MEAATTTSTAAGTEIEGSDEPRVAEQLLYRFEADLQVTPVGLTPEGIRMTVEFDGTVTAGMLEGARVWGVDPFLMRADGVGIIDAPKTISDGERTVYEYIRAYLKAPEGLEVPPPEVVLDPAFEWPEVFFPILGFSQFRAGHPDYAHLNGTQAAVEGSASFASGRLGIETRVLRHTGTVAPPALR
jgi:hypothetical protein